MVEKFECSFCGGRKFKQVFTAFDFDASAEPFELKQCNQCELTQTCPNPTTSTLDKYYSKSYYGSGPKKFSWLIEHLTVLGCKSRAKHIIKFLPKTGKKHKEIKVLDIGCGRANLLGELSKSGIKCYGTERDKFPTDHEMLDITIHNGSLEERQFENSFFDAVIIWHVLEHLSRPAKTLDEVTRITRDGGLIVIAVPNFFSFQSRLFRAKWFHLDLPRHLYHFNIENLKRALTNRRYQVQRLSTCSLEQNVFGFIQSFMNSFRFLGKPNSFYQLLKGRSGIADLLKLAFWTLFGLLIFPFALLEFGISCISNKGASVIIFAHKA